MSQFFSGRIIAGPGETCDWFEIDGERIVRKGSGEPPGESERLPGVVLPGFIDAHVHLTTTGLYSSGLDFSGCMTVKTLLATLEAFLAHNGSNWIIGGNFDPGRTHDHRMPTRTELDAVSGGRAVLISRADGHSCSLNSEGLSAAGPDPGTIGIELDDRGEPTGVLSAAANYETRSRFFSALPREVLADGQERGCMLAARRGVTSVHEMAGGAFMGDGDFEVLVQRLSSLPIRVKPYLATFDLTKVADVGLDCIGGDLFLDGSIGSHTAAMSEPYEDDAGTGHLYHSDETIADWFTEATEMGLQAGVHAIGDSAINQALGALEEAGRRVTGGLDKVRSMRHRIEHFECVDDDDLKRAEALGVIPSVQPAFDRYWGGKGRMYDTRLGERAASMNPFSLMTHLQPAGGSDSTVTPLNPLLGLSSAIAHSNPEYSVSFDVALAMFTLWAARAGRMEDEVGSLTPGKYADFCVLGSDPRTAAPDELTRIQVLETWVGGEQVFSAQT